MRRKHLGLVFLTAVAAKRGQDRTDLVRLQSQLGEAQATRRHESQSLLGCHWTTWFRSRPRCYPWQRIVNASTYKQNFVNLLFPSSLFAEASFIDRYNIAQRLASAFIMSRVDYCNAVLADLPASTLAPLQWVLIAASCFVAGATLYTHVSGIMKSLHWLPIAYRIRFKLCVLMHGVHNRTGPLYLTNTTTKISSLSGHRQLRSAMTTEYNIPRTKTKFGDRMFSVAGPRSGTLFPPI